MALFKHSIDTVDMWLGRIFEHEKGFTDSRADPGNWTGGKVGVGELKGTNWGIAANTYGHLDIKNLTRKQAAGIYEKDFLIPLKADHYDDGVAFQMLDFAVNSGPHRALRSIQRAINVKDDGLIGPITLARLRTYSESDLIMLILAERIDFITGLSNWDVHGKGWARRIAMNLRYGAIDS